MELSRVGAAVDDGRLDPPVRITLRPLGTPLPLGFFSFAIGSFAFTTLDLAWIGKDQLRPMAIIVIVFVVPLQLLAAVLAFWGRDAGGGTAVGLFGTTWAAIGAVSLAVPAPTVQALGVLLLCLGVVMICLAVVSAPGKPVFSVVLTLACVRFVTMGLYELGHGTGWQRASGWLGIPLSAAAVYLGLALLLEDVQHRTILPLFRRGAARMSLESHLGDQVGSIEREAGVREQL